VRIPMALAWATLAAGAPCIGVACSSSSGSNPTDGAVDTAQADHASQDGLPADATNDGTEKLACEVFFDGAPLERDGSLVIIYPESGECPDGDQPLV
jgi:hypothetical protein